MWPIDFLGKKLSYNDKATLAIREMLFREKKFSIKNIFFYCAAQITKAIKYNYVIPEESDFSSDESLEDDSIGVPQLHVLHTARIKFVGHAGNVLEITPELRRTIFRYIITSREDFVHLRNEETHRLMVRFNIRSTTAMNAELKNMIRNIHRNWIKSPLSNLKFVERNDDYPFPTNRWNRRQNSNPAKFWATAARQHHRLAQLSQPQSRRQLHQRLPLVQGNCR